MTAAVDSGLYKVPKERASIEIKAPPLGPERKTIFLSSCAASHQGAETASDIFNSSGTFLPLMDDPEGITLVRRDSVHWVRIEDPERVEWHYLETREGAPRSRVRCGFEDGEMLEGVVFAIGPIAEQRVQDVVNRGEQFLHLDTERGLFLVNLRRVARVTVLEQGDAGP